jgi:hypothetical protein
MMMKERMSRAITSWLPLSTVAAGIAMMAGSLMNLPVAKTVAAAIASAAMTFSAFLMRSYGKKEKENYPNSLASQQK